LSAATGAWRLELRLEAFRRNVHLCGRRMRAMTTRYGRGRMQRELLKSKPAKAGFVA
jgi:hypothetical protein